MEAANYIYGTHIYIYIYKIVYMYIYIYIYTIIYIYIYIYARPVLGVYGPHVCIYNDLKAFLQSLSNMHIYTLEFVCARLNPACTAQWCYKTL